MKEKFDSLLSVAGLEIVQLVAGAFGAAVALFLANRTEADDAKKLTLSGKIVTWLAGTITAAYIGPLIIEAATLPAKATAGVIFFAGLGALSFAEALLKQMPEIIKALRIKFLGG